jgi:F0F1-type ATP synthase assembly protein I
MAESQEPSQHNKKLSQYNSYLKYSGLAIQLLLVIAVFGWLGYQLDQKLGYRIPVFMLVFGFLSFVGMMYQIYRSINRQ